MATTAQPPGSPTDPQATLPPHSIESEQAILGAIILSEKAHYAYVVEEEITAADFYRTRHRVIFEALLGLFDRGSEARGRLVFEPDSRCRRTRFEGNHRL